MNKILIFNLLICLITFGCSKEATNTINCEAQVVDGCIYTQEFNPVCGCNKVTYSNAGHAACNGITEFTQGPCDSKLSDILGNWKLLGFESDGLSKSNLKKSHAFEINLNFSDERASDNAATSSGYSCGGKSSVNIYGGNYMVNGSNELKIFNLISTEIAGEPKAQLYEEKYFKGLIFSQTFEISGKNLIITSEALIENILYKEKMYFEKQ